MPKFKPKYYTVYREKTDELVCLDATAEEAAKTMGVSFKSFHSICTRVRKGINRKWSIEAVKEREVLA